MKKGRGNRIQICLRKFEGRRIGPNIWGFWIIIATTHLLSSVCLVSQLRPTLCNPMDCGPPGSSVHGILQARILEGVAISSLRGSSPSLAVFPVTASLATSKVKVKSLSHVWLFVTSWTVAYQAPPSMGFSRQEYWSGWPFPSPGDLPDPGTEPESPALQAHALPSEPPGKSKKATSRKT